MKNTTPPPQKEQCPTQTGEATTTTTEPTTKKPVNCSTWAAFTPLPVPLEHWQKLAALVVIALVMLTGCAGDMVMFSEVTYSNQASSNSTAVQVIGDNNSAWVGETPPAAPAYTGRPASDWLSLFIVFGAAAAFILMCLYVMKIGPFSEHYY